MAAGAKAGLDQNAQSASYLPLTLTNTIFLPDQSNSIDLVKTLIEILIVEKPLKNLCSSICKGLCSNCGKNLNNRTCSCVN